MSSSSARFNQSRRVAEGIRGNGLFRLVCRARLDSEAYNVDAVEGVMLAQPEVLLDELVCGLYMEGMDRRVDCVRGGLVGVGIPGFDGVGCICIIKGDSGRPPGNVADSPESSTTVTIQKSPSGFLTDEDAPAARCWLAHCPVNQCLGFPIKMGR